MSEPRITVVDNAQPAVTIVENGRTYTFTVTTKQYVYTVTPTEFYHPALQFNKARNSMYLEVLPIF